MKVHDVSNETILYACNDWGFGHLARSIGIINQLLAQNNTVYFAGNEKQNEIIQEYCPECIFEQLEGYDFHFSGHGNWSLEMAKNAMRLQRKMAIEYRFVKTFCEAKPISYIFSDHRYGFIHSDIPSVFITHQLRLPLSGILKIANFWHTKQLKKFSVIWVLDDEQHSYAGKLSFSNTTLPIQYIGIQSRFEQVNYPVEEYILAVVSGPSPYAEQLFQDIISFAKSSESLVKCICPEEYFGANLPSNLQVYHSLTWKEIDNLFYACASIISRSGYTTIMDAIRLNKKVVFIPTPGQFEQTYLAELHR